MLKKAKAKPRTRRKRRGDSEGPVASRCSIRRSRSGSPDSARSRRRRPEGTKVFETLVKQGEALEIARRARPRPTRRPRRAAPPRRRRRRCSRWRAARGTSWSRCSRIASRARCRSSACYTQSDVERLAERVDALAEAVNELIKATGGSRRRARPRRAKARPSARKRQAPPSAPRGDSARSARQDAKRTRDTREAVAWRRRRSRARCEAAPARPLADARAPSHSRLSLLDLLDVVRHRLVLAHPLELGPRVVLRAADEIEAARPLALDVAVGRLLVVRVELEQRRVVGLLLRLLGGRGGGFELRLEVVLLRGGHRASSSGRIFRVRGVSCYFSANAESARNARARRPTRSNCPLPCPRRKRDKISAVDTAWLRMDRPQQPDDDQRRADLPRAASRSRACASVIAERFLRVPALPPAAGARRPASSFWETDAAFRPRRITSCTSALPGRAGKRGAAGARVARLARRRSIRRGRCGSSISSRTTTAAAR